MSREIKFRCFDEKEGVYFNGWDGSEITIQFYQEENKAGEIGYIQYKDLGCSCNPDDACGGCIDIWQSEPLTKDSIIEQFTGLLDKNGKEIFEGDIISSGKVMWQTDGDKSIREVKFWDGCFMIGVVPLHILSPQFHPEIIGNIHENPELLK